MERTEFKTNDGRYLYKVSCHKCGSDRGLQPKKSVHSLCRSCSSKEYRIKVPQNRSVESYLPSQTLKNKYLNIALSFVCQFKKFFV
jgi:ribosomal protein L40E